jgi:hypothetical protein
MLITIMLYSERQKYGIIDKQVIRIRSRIIEKCHCLRRLLRSQNITYVNLPINRELREELGIS